MRAKSTGSQLSAVQHVVLLMLENRSFDHMLGFLYAASGNKSPKGQAFDGLTTNADESHFGLLRISRKRPRPGR